MTYQTGDSPNLDQYEEIEIKNRCEDCKHWYQFEKDKTMGACYHPTPQGVELFRGVVKYGWETACKRDFQPSC